MDLPAAVHVYGAAIFGVGFGLTGTCPGGAVAMVATGGLGGLLVLVGLVSGMWLREATARPARRRHSTPQSIVWEPSPRASQPGGGGTGVLGRVHV